VAVDPVLKTHPRAIPYKPGTWGPKEADALIAAQSGWHNPTLTGGGLLKHIPPKMRA
jgi:glucose-6-phosphate 1-dehydrogenase